MAQTALPLIPSMAVKSAEQTVKSHFHAPSYLYRKGNIYYFRYALPKQLRKALGSSEIRFSLRTAYLREAKPLADKLYHAVCTEMDGGQMLEFAEVKNRLARVLKKLIELQSARFEKVKDITSRIGEDVALSSQEMADVHKGLYQSKVRQKEKYEEWVSQSFYDPLTGVFNKNGYDEVANKPFKSEYFFALYAEKHAHLLVDEGYFSKNELEENKAVIGKALMQAFLVFDKHVVADENGDAIEAQKIVSDYIITATPAGVPPLPSVKPPTQKLLFSEAVERYVAAKLREQAWKERNVQDIRGRLDNFIGIIGDKAIEDITRNDMRSFVETLQKLPPNREKSRLYAGKTIAEVLEMNPVKQLNVATINTILESVVSMLEWYVREGLLAKNPARGLQIKDNREAIELRDPFSREELELIFAHPKFTLGKFKHPSYFWAPLIGLFTGMRLEEIAQLHCADLYQLEGNPLWAIDINDRGKDEEGRAKSLKNKNARRLIPVHQTLIDLGLLKYHARMTSTGRTRLFPELRVTLKTPKLGKQPGKQFKRVVDAALGAAEKKSFHSLRHTFGDFYKHKGWQNDFFRQLYGHDMPELAAKQYGSKFPPELLYKEVIEKLDYGLDLSKLAVSKYVLLK